MLSHGDTGDEVGREKEGERETVTEIETERHREIERMNGNGDIV